MRSARQPCRLRRRSSFCQFGAHNNDHRRRISSDGTYRLLVCSPKGLQITAGGLGTAAITHFGDLQGETGGVGASGAGPFVEMGFELVEQAAAARRDQQVFDVGGMGFGERITTCGEHGLPMLRPVRNQAATRFRTTS